MSFVKVVCVKAQRNFHIAGLEGGEMPEKSTIERAKQDTESGKSPSTQAGEFVREEIHHVREGVHGARSVQQAIAIGLSKARRAGVKLPAPKKGSSAIRRQARRDLSKGRSSRKVSKNRSRATLGALRRESHGTVTHDRLAAQARSSSRRRGPAARHRASLRAVHTKGPLGLRRGAAKAARTRRKTS
jgi:hypothetical protein